ncbi:MAG TPA: T9SS type A sorting domain-containing protein [Flavobacteriales bacterium]|nr:T9SS type A sorting domain-containing protein [Flavobacteriales bacterium]
MRLINYFLLVLLSLSSLNSNAGTCAGPTPVTVDGACSGANVNETSIYAAPTGCAGTIATDEWWTFSGTTGVSYTVAYVGNTTDDACIAVYTGSCGSMTLVGCVNATGSSATPTETYTFTAGSTTTYYVRVLNYGSGNMGTTSLCVTSAAAAPSNDNPCTATAVTVGSSCSFTTFTNASATSSTGVPAPGCASYAGGDVWFTATVPASGQMIFDSNTGVITDGGMAVYSGTCSSLTLVACDDDNSSNGAMPYLSLTGLTPGATVWIRFWEYNNDNNGTFSLCVYDPCPACSGTPAGGTANASATSITSCTSLTTNLSLTGAATGCNISYQWQSSPNNVTWTNISGATSSTYTASVAATTYFRCVVTCNLSGLSAPSTSVLVTSTVSPPSNDEPCSAIALTVGTTCSFSTYTNSCASASAGIPAPGCASYAGGDVWFSVTVPTSGMLIFDSNTGVITDGGMAVYSGTCSSMTLIGCDDDNSTNGAMPYLSLTGLTAGSTVWVRFWEYNNDNNGTFSICVTNPCPVMCTTPTGGTASASPSTTSCASTSTTLSLAGASSGCGISYQWQSSPDGVTWTNIAGATSTTLSTTAPTTTYYQCLVICSGGSTTASSSTVVTYSGTPPANDLPCNAVTMTLGVTEGGDNVCSGNTGDPAVPGCWTGGSYNTVWYQVTTTSTSLKIKTNLGTLTNTQIAVYSGTCSSLTFVAGSCNDNGPACGSTTIYSSEISLTGLTAGATYFIAVDGNNSLTGTFGIVAIDGSSSWPLVAGQECLSPNPVCSSSITVADPGYQGIGNYCDIPSSYCLLSAERGSVWYSWTTNAAGNINFDIVPNNWPGAPSTTAADYDFALWKLSGSVTCASILAGTSTPLACNYNSLGVTGCSPTGNAPAAYPGFDGSYEPQVACALGDQFILLINNHSTSVDGFNLNFATGGGGAPISYVTAPTSVTWTGGTSTAWNLSSNWGGCAYPICGIDATINPFVVMPTVTGNQYVKDLTINPGATLTLAAGSILHICGNLLNSGTIIASPTSTIIFDNAAVVQTMTGNFTGTSALGNLTITKTGGSVTTNDDVAMKGTFTTSNTTSIFNTSGKYITVAGNFTNNNGSSTFTNVGTTGTLEFNGTSTQNYTQGSSVLDLNYVLMNHTGTGVTLLSDMNIKTTTGTLTLTLGKIITGATYQVYVKNNAVGACTAGNTSSFVQGYLRRAISGTGAFEFPVGESVKGYQRATINFTTASTDINNIRADFVQYGSTPAALMVTDCTVPYNLPFLNNGKWNINAYNAGMTQITGTGVYNCTLWPLAGSYTNHTSAVEWTVAKDPGTGWGIVGTCNLASVVNQVIRDGMTGFSGFGVEQSTTTLPVELISFEGEKSNQDHLLKWVTASEINNAWFIIEHSVNGHDFSEIHKTEGKAMSNVITDYHFLFKYPVVGLNYYRLRQVNTNGTYSFSNIVVLDNTEDLILLENLFPNPTNGDIQFDLTTNEDQDFSIDVYDISGKIVLQKKYSQEEGKKTVVLETSQLSRGVYTLQVCGQNTSFKSIQRIVRN